MIVFPYKSTPFSKIFIRTEEIPRFPIIVLWNYSNDDLSFYHSYNGKPNVMITEEEYYKICKELEYDEEFASLIND